MIRLDIQNESSSHFVVSGDEPFRVEVKRVPNWNKNVSATTIIAHVYTGVLIDKDQHPIGSYDGTLDENHSWVVT